MENILNESTYDHCKLFIQKAVQLNWMPLETKELMAQYYNSMTIENATSQQTLLFSTKQRTEKCERYFL